MKIAELRAYKNGQAYLLLQKEIKEDYTLADFQNLRIYFIEKFKYDFDRFETELF